MKTIEQLSAELASAYATLTTLVGQAGQIDLQLFEATNDLTDARAKILRESDPKAMGSNEAQREAYLRAATVIQRQTVGDLEQARLELRPLVEVARLNVEHLRAQLRLIECASGIQRAA